MSNEEPARYLIVTLEQLADGYLEKIGMFITKKDYIYVRRYDEGAAVVYNPEWIRYVNSQGKQAMIQSGHGKEERDRPAVSDELT